MLQGSSDFVERTKLAQSPRRALSFLGRGCAQIDRLAGLSSVVCPDAVGLRGDVHSGSGIAPLVWLVDERGHKIWEPIFCMVDGG